MSCYLLSKLTKPNTIHLFFTLIFLKSYEIECFCVSKLGGYDKEIPGKCVCIFAHVIFSLLSQLVSFFQITIFIKFGKNSKNIHVYVISKPKVDLKETLLKDV